MARRTQNIDSEDIRGTTKSQLAGFKLNFATPLPNYANAYIFLRLSCSISWLGSRESRDANLARVHLGACVGVGPIKIVY